MAILRQTAVTGSYCSRNESDQVAYLQLPVYGAPSGLPPAAVAQGSIWYNSQNGYVMTQTCLCIPSGPAAWSAGGSYTTSRRFAGSAGNVNAGLTFTGISGPTRTTSTEEYNGTSWSGGGNVTTARYWIIQAGTQNSALMGGGYNPPTHYPTTEEYNGLTWSGGGAVPTPQWYASGTAGASQNSATTWSAQSLVSCTFEYNGTSWSAGGTSPAPALGSRGAGTQNDALRAAGANTATNLTAEYNGTSWSAGGSQPATQRNGEAWGTSTNAAGANGSRSPGSMSSVCTILYNGSSWSGGPNSPVGTFGLSGAGSQDQAFVGGGNNPSITTVREFQPGISCVGVCVCWCRIGPYTPF